MEKTYLTLNLPNFVTVLIIVAIGYAVIGTVLAFFAKNLPSLSGSKS